MRTHAKDLPTAEEIKSMMAKEAQRKPSTSNHFSDYSVACEWLELLGLDFSLFTNTKTIDEVNEKAFKIKPLVVLGTLQNKANNILEKVEKYLGEEDKLEKADIAIIFGGATLLRAEKGAEMYLAGWVDRLLMTGKGPNYKGVFDRPEAEVFKDRAIQLGVPKDKIIEEKESINIPSNVRASLNLLDELGIQYHSIMQIASWYPQRRTWVTMKKYLDPKVKIIRVNSTLPKIGNRPAKYEKGEWYKTEEGIEIIFNEFVKMRHQEVTNAG